MTTQTVTLDLPELLYQKLRLRAAQSQRTVEDELLTEIDPYHSQGARWAARGLGRILTHRHDMHLQHALVW